MARTTRFPLRLAAVPVAAAAVLAGVVATASPAYAATTRYVAVGNAQCSDSGPGTEARPFCSIVRAAEVAIAGDTVLVASGTYVGEVEPANSGTSTAPITYQAAPGATVVVTGGTRGFAVRSRSWIVIAGFHVTGTEDNGIYLKSATSITLRYNRVSHVGAPGDSDTTAQGIYVIGTKTSSLIGNTADHNSDTGIYVASGNSGIEVRGNTAFANARGYTRAATGIDVRSPGTTVTANLSYNNEDSGIQLYNGAHSSKVVNNVTYGNGDHGIDVLNSTDTVVVSNTVYDNATAGINLEGASGTAASSRGTLRNNISVENALASTSTRGNIRVDARSLTGTTLDHDLLHLSRSGTMVTWGTTQYLTLAAFRTATGQEQRGLEADPLWQAPATGDFHLRAGSPAIDSAASSAPSQPAADIEGTARVDDPAVPNTGTGTRAFDDRGAYEHKPVPIAELSVTPSSGEAPLTVQADASGSSSVIGIASYRFDWGDGTAATGPQTSPLASHTYGAVGTFTVTVTVTDTAGKSSTGEAQVRARAADEPPTAALSVSPATGDAPLTVTADASASTDPDVTPIEIYTFDFGDGTVVGPQPGATADHTYADVGTFTVTVTVTDTGGQSATATADVSVTDPNLVGNPGFEASTAGWNANGRTGITLARVAGGRSGGWAGVLTNTTSSTAADCTLNDAPNWVSATSAGTYRAVVWVRSTTGDKTIRLRLREYSGGVFVGSSPVVTATVGGTWTRLTTDLTVQAPGSTLDFSAYTLSAVPGACFSADDVSITRHDAVPVADLSVSPSSGEAPLPVQADASGSSPAASITSYRFDWGDGSAATGPQTSPTASHTYSAAGTFTVTVTVTGSAGLTSTATADVTVGAEPDPNLVGNPGFEASTAGWNANGRTGIALSRVAGGHSGGWAAELTNTTTSAAADCTLNDAPNWVAATSAGTYRASVWVRSTTGDKTIRLRLREYSGGVFVGSSPVVTATVGATWTQLTTDLTVQAPGSTIDFTAYTLSAAPGSCFTADDVSITLL